MTAQMAARDRKCACGGACSKCASKPTHLPQVAQAVQPHNPQRVARDFSRVPVHASRAGEGGGS
jgi:hypothetical protein